MSLTNRAYLTLGAFVILAAAVFGALSPAMAVIAGIALVTALVAFSMVWRSGTPPPPMRQVLYDLEPHEPRAGTGRR